ncbi:MAG TPA: DNA-processing protein DprA [Aestuariivirgaceae bacterium]|nr:DNA-processing protein DprA [Aestuariivirgaceae bacterium]
MPASLSNAERRDWLRLSRSENVGPASFRLLMERFGTAEAALDALPDLSRRGGLNRSIRVYGREEAERDLERADELGARFVARDEPDYPPLLRHIEQAPPLICLKGRTELFAMPAVAVVGTRSASALGRKFARELSVALGKAGLLVVSGLARGIDTVAHEASLQTGTVAVMAGGIDVIYPPENETLYHAIAERGVLVTEMTPGTVPRAESFPRRNRLISGISLGVLVVEAALRSGSLITARLAGEQGREVFAVPGSPLDPRCAGTNKLLREGATLVTGASDVIDVMRDLDGRARRDATGFVESAAIEHNEPDTDSGPEPDLRARIIELLGSSSVEIDDLIRESRAPAQAVLTVLLELELAGRLERFPASRVGLTG